MFFFKQGICQNGGTSVPTLHSGQHMFCLCPDGFHGDECETGLWLSSLIPTFYLTRHLFLIHPRVDANSYCHSPSLDTSACYIGRGRYYRGTESRSRSGRTCLVWDVETRERFIAASDVNSGRHNYCRLDSNESPPRADSTRRVHVAEGVAYCSMFGFPPRNPTYRLRPWCYLWKNGRLVKEYCNIPRCDFVPGKCTVRLCTTDRCTDVSRLQIATGLSFRLLCFSPCDV